MLGEDFTNLISAACLHKNRTANFEGSCIHWLDVRVRFPYVRPVAVTTPRNVLLCNTQERFYQVVLSKFLPGCLRYPSQPAV